MKKFFLVLITIITTFSTMGCKGAKQEIEKLAVIVALGFDLSPENKYIVTAQILNPQKQSSSRGIKGTGGLQAPSDVAIYSATGDTPIDAMSHLSTVLGKQLFVSQIKFLVYGEKLAESGLSLAFDAAFRTFAVRIDAIIFVTKDSASDIVSALTASETIPANAITNLIRLQSIRGYAPIIRRIDFANALQSKTATPVAGVICLDKSRNIDSTFIIGGTAVFKKDKLIGYLDINQTRGMQWIMGHVKDGTITMYLKDNEIATLDILTSKGKIRPIIKNDNIVMEIIINEEANLRELTADLDPMKFPETIDKLNKIQNEAIKREVTLAIDAAQGTLNSDMLGFGNIIHENYPDIWKKLKKNWNTVFPNIKVEVTVNSSIKRPGLISKPVEHTE